MLNLQLAPVENPTGASSIFNWRSRNNNNQLLKIELAPLEFSTGAT